jgi:hypothetical protein
MTRSLVQTGLLFVRTGRRLSAVRDGITSTFSHNDADQTLTESYSRGTFNALSMNWAYASSLRVASVTAKSGDATLRGATYGCDTAGRLQSVADGSHSSCNRTVVAAAAEIFP